MTAPRVQFLFDFGSPNAYLSHRVIPAIEARTGVKFEYVPILLGGLFKLTNNRSPAEAFAGIDNKLKYERLEVKRFVHKHGLSEFKLNPYFPVMTIQIMRGAIAAQREGCFERYVDEIFRHMWAQPKKMDDPAVIHDALVASGLDAERLMARAQDADVKAQLIANTQAAFDAGAFGSPSFLVDGELYFGKDRLPDVEERIQSAKGVAAAQPARASA